MRVTYAFEQDTPVRIREVFHCIGVFRKLPS